MRLKITTIIGSLLTIGLLAGCETEHGERHEKKEAKLMSEAKISRETAEATAKARVPNGTIKEGELEREHGKLQWSFDMAVPGEKKVTEVNVDAITGEIIGVDKE